jgi:hypothetical protein
MRVTGTCIAFRATRPMCFASIRATAASPCTAHSGTAPTSFRELTSILTGLSGRCLRAASKSCASTRQIPLLCKACVLSRSAEVLWRRERAPARALSAAPLTRPTQPTAHSAAWANREHRSVGKKGCHSLLLFERPDASVRQLPLDAAAAPPAASGAKSNLGLGDLRACTDRREKVLIEKSLALHSVEFAPRETGRERRA